MSGRPYTHLHACPRGPRDSASWYLEADPIEQVDGALVEFVARHAGREVLDLGCGIGGYTRALRERGLACRGADVVPEYVERARELGVDADLLDGDRLPYDDDSFDTVIALEVLEHVEDPAALLSEARRVTRGGVLVSVPNCTQEFAGVPVEFSHMLDVDHRHWFTAASLEELLGSVFGSADVVQSAPVDRLLAGLVLPRPLRPIDRLLRRTGLVRPRFYSRLLGRAPVHG
ncbi:MAG: class I SAM-dependent methyltransferase [Thermoleophilaceae bacterium]